MRALSVSATLFLFVAFTVCAVGEEPTTTHLQAAVPTPLTALLDEASSHSPEIQAAVYGYQAARNVSKAAGALPDTQVFAQSLSVGSPRPLAGYTNSDFAYIGVGASQQIPFPGKRGLRSEVARHQASALEADAESVKRRVLQQVKMAYFQLAYLQATLGILQRDNRLLGDIEQIAESRYRVGQGNQQEVLRAQLQHTKILQEITMHHQQVGAFNAELKRLLGRSQDSRDITTDLLVPRSLSYTNTQLLEFAVKQNPEIQSSEENAESASSQVTLAQREFRPDFNVQYMYQNTGPKFRDYYMATLGINLPNRGRRRAELAQAEEKHNQAAENAQAARQKILAAVQDRYVFITTSQEQLNIYQGGLIPQSQASLRSAMDSYQSNRQDFQTLLASFLDVLSLETEYQRQLAEHESAMAELESLTGVTLQ